MKNESVKLLLLSEVSMLVVKFVMCVDVDEERNGGNVWSSIPSEADPAWSREYEKMRMWENVNELIELIE
jgi:hypothetical protein